ncbi:MAG: radical SAM protein [archaeon]
MKKEESFCIHKLRNTCSEKECIKNKDYWNDNIFQIKNNSNTLSYQHNKNIGAEINDIGNIITLNLDGKWIYISPIHNKMFVSDAKIDIKKNRIIEDMKQCRSDEISKLGFSFTNDCNLNCTYCQLERGKETIDIDYILDHIEKLTPKLNKKIEIDFTGNGENTLRQDYIKTICTFFKEKNFQITTSIIMNGYISRQSLKVIEEYIDNIAISFDGLPEIHDKYRKTNKNNKTSDIVLQNIKKLIEQNKEIDITCLIHEETIEKFEEIIKFLTDIDIKVISFKGLKPAAIETNYKNIDNKRFLFFISRFNEYLLEFNNLPLRKELLLPKYGSIFPSSCVSKMKNSVYLNHNKKLSFCIQCSSHKDANGLNFNNIEAFYENELQINKFEKCIDCSIRYYCFGGCILHNYDKKGDIYDLYEEDCFLNKNKLSNFAGIVLNHYYYKNYPFFEIKNDGLYLRFKYFSRKIDNTSTFYFRLNNQREINKLSEFIEKIDTKEINIHPFIILDVIGISAFLSKSTGALTKILDEKKISYRYVYNDNSSDNISSYSKCANCLYLYHKKDHQIMLCNGTVLEDNNIILRRNLFKIYIDSLEGTCHKTLKCKRNPILELEFQKMCDILV